MSRRSWGLSDDVLEYVRAMSVREGDVFVRLREETAELTDRPGMQISPELGAFMQLIIKLMEARKGIEVGTFTGYSTLCMALAMPDYGRVVSCEVNGEWASIARRYWRAAGVEDRIELKIAPAAETMESLVTSGQAGSFDVIFVDADKRGYDTYYELSLKLLRPGGLVMIDNVLWGGSAADPERTDETTMAIKALNEKIRHDNRVTIAMVPIGDGVTLARKRQGNT